MNKSASQKPHVLITAGTTREMIDQVRCWMNIFTGQTGLDIAMALLPTAHVTLVSSNSDHRRQFQAAIEAAGDVQSAAIGFQTHQELLDLLSRLVSATAYAAAIMTAAVSDYRPDGAFEILSSWEIQGGAAAEYHWIVRRVDRAKIRSEHKQIAFRGIPTEKIIDRFRSEWSFGGLLVKFKLEVDMATGELLKTANRSRLSSGADLIVANTLEMVCGPEPKAWLIDDFEQRCVPRADLATALRDYLLKHFRR